MDTQHSSHTPTHTPRPKHKEERRPFEPPRLHVEGHLKEVTTGHSVDFWSEDSRS